MRRRHLTSSNILGVPGLERLVARSALRGALNALLTKPDGLDVVAFAGHNNMRLCGVIRGAFWLIVPRDAGTL